MNPISLLPLPQDKNKVKWAKLWHRRADLGQLQEDTKGILGVALIMTETGTLRFSSQEDNVHWIFGECTLQEPLDSTSYLIPVGICFKHELRGTSGIFAINDSNTLLLSSSVNPVAATSQSEDPLRSPFSWIRFVISEWQLEPPLRFFRFDFLLWLLLSDKPALFFI